ncbi:sensor histidine kinase [Halohasta salina]|uniref:sensor histidine kinase n=1 Tax=Halohasta salina TaxID=2961621 RepID=UPI0020A27555|nr:HAMP domain-containing sensor histidine kinase [Halohasta salina]
MAPAPADGTADGTTDRMADARSTPIERVVAADKPREIFAVTETALTALEPVEEAWCWRYEPDDERLEPAADDGPASPSTVTTAAFEAGAPRYPAADDSAPDAAAPLGEAGAVALRAEACPPAVRTRLDRLSTVAGERLEAVLAYRRLEDRFQQVAERNRELTQFARTVSHDLNSPLSVIYGRIELALDEPSNAELHLRAARNAAKRVDSLVTDHLQTIEAHDDDATEPVSVQTVAIRAWRIVDPSTARLRVEPTLGSVEANPIRLQQLFENLIRNAIEHGSAESVGLGADAGPTDPHAVFEDDTDSVTVTIKPTSTGFAVCDDGPGIPDDQREAIFESGYTTTEAGSGLGLHIVEEIVEAHDWSIAVDESDSGGARFEVSVE